MLCRSSSGSKKGSGDGGSEFGGPGVGFVVVGRQGNAGGIFGGMGAAWENDENVGVNVGFGAPPPPLMLQRQF